jgi:UDP-sugar pyrophosphorylase
MATPPLPSTLSDHLKAGVLTNEDLALAEILLAEDQQHLFADWDAPGSHDAEKREFFQTLHTCHRSYPGGLPAYIRNARRLLKESATGANPFEGCVPVEPETVDLSAFGASYEEAEAVGLRCFAETAVVLVAGGLGERLGYHGIKLDIPVETTLGTTYLAHYASILRVASLRLGRDIPLVIMTSRETRAGTESTLASNKNFGLAPGQITLLNQELVPALADIDAHLGLEKKYQLNLKPHGHGDIHTLLHTSGTAKKFAHSGIRYLLFIQDTNGQVFNAALAALGVSEIRGYDFNSIAVNRIPGEAVGGIATLRKTGSPDLTINVEYNYLDPLLRETVNPAGDVAEPNGFSRFPGNINVLAVRLAPYLSVLESSGGIIAEFANPKFADSARTAFKKPARLETLMQDLPKSFVAGEKVGVTIFDRAWCFSPCKNNLADAAAKVAAGGPPESASSAESDFYLAGRIKLRAAGMEVLEAPAKTIRGVPITPGPRVILHPSFALTLADVRARIRGGSISGDATLILEGDATLEHLVIPDGATVVAKAPEGETLSLKNQPRSSPMPSYRMEELTDAEMTSEQVPESLRIRGYRIAPSPLSPA